MSNIPVNYSPEDCHWCGTSGRADSGKCMTCFGQGSVLVAQPSRACAWCNGTGRSDDTEAKKCMSCFGCGWAHRHTKSSS
jgi:DnaJ-class molecular chaperone